MRQYMNKRELHSYDVFFAQAEAALGKTVLHDDDWPGHKQCVVLGGQCDILRDRRVEPFRSAVESTGAVASAIYREIQEFS